jgi:hypothetical protein
VSEETRPVEGEQIDQGVPVGDADVQADLDRASDEDREPADDEFIQQAAAEGRTDQGEPVGIADLEEDRRRAGS